MNTPQEQYIRDTVLRTGVQHYTARTGPTAAMPSVTVTPDKIKVPTVAEACHRLFFEAAGFCLAYYDDRLPRDVTATLSALWRGAHGHENRRSILGIGIEFFERNVAGNNENVRTALKEARLAMALTEANMGKLNAIKAEEARQWGTWTR